MMGPVTDHSRETAAQAADIAGGGAGAAEQEPRIGFEEHARISAEIAEGDEPQNQILERHQISEADWLAATNVHMSRLAQDTLEKGAEATLAIRYSEIFSEHQRKLKPVADYSPEQWAELAYDIEREGSPERPLSARQLSLADYFRLLDSFTRRIVAEPAVAVRVERRMRELSQAPAPASDPER